MAKKGVHWLVWVGLGCGAIVLVGMVAMGGLAWFGVKKAGEFVEDIAENPVTNTARAFALANPELEFVSADEEKKVAVFRKPGTEDTYTISLEDMAAGRFEFEGPDGKVEISANEGGVTVATDESTTQYGAAAAGTELPGWVPKPEAATIVVQYAQSGSSGTAGAFQIKGMAVDEVLAFYSQALESAGFEISTQNIAGQGSSLSTVGGRHSDGRQVNVISAGGEEIAVTYAQN